MFFGVDKFGLLRREPGFRRGYSRVVAVAIALVASGSCAVAQGVDCGRLQAQIASAGRGNVGQASRYASAANKQQAEIERTAAYAQSIGCNNRQFLMFGSAPPAQCGGINARIQQMRGNVASLQAQAQSASGDGQRRDLQARFDAYCRGQPSGRGLFDALFGRGNERTTIPIEDERPAQRQRSDERNDDDDDDRPRGGSQAVCVRTCDGGFFPISYSARRSNLDDLEELCKALCPNVEAALYTYSGSRDIDSATSTDGEPYTALKNAGKYRTKYDPTCSCKPPHKSWVEALADAEALLGRKAKSDILVTPQKAEELSRGKQSPAARASAEPVATANKSSVKAFGLGDGLKREEEGANGARKRVRVIDPNL